MEKIQLVDIEETVLDKLYNEYRNNPKRKVREKAGVIYYRAKGYSEREIREIVGIATPTITRHVKNYNISGVSYIYTTKYTGPKSMFNLFENDIINELDKRNVKTIEEALDIVKKLYNIIPSKSVLRRFLKKHGFRYLKSRSMPAKADKIKQKEFHDNTLMPLLERAKKGEIEVYFGDAVHVIHGGELGYCWCRKRVEILTKSGRQRYNVMGCYNFLTNKTITVTNNTYITSTEIVALFKKIREFNGDKTVYIILDNAKYQKSEIVKEAAEKYNIKIIYLPPYSPNLNLIERLWKLLRKTCLCNKYHETFNEFCKEIDDFLNETSTTYRDAVASLLTPNFQI